MTINIPSHIAVIMDGNSRWSKINNLPKEDGYKKGIKTLENLIDICIKKKIKILTVYALSTENIHRKDIGILYSLINEFIKDNKNITKFKEVDFRLIGDRSNIEENISSYFKKLENNNNNNKKIILNLAYNYGSWKEIEYCISNILDKYNKNQFSKSNINESLIKNNLYTKNIPNPDILIRTGGNKRLSNFLLLQLRYTELFFIDTLWPDFNETLFIKILEEFKNRRRTYGL